MKSVLLAPLVAAFLLGCDHAPPPTRPVHADPGDALFACGSWSPQEPSVAVAVFDLNVIGSAPLEAIQAAGGVILYEFHVPLVRARLPVSAVRELYNSRHVWFARQVREGQALEFDGVIGIPTPLSAADRDFLESVGVTVLREYRDSRFISALIPDSAIPAIEKHPGVWGVEMNNLACVHGERVRVAPLPAHAGAR